MFRMNLLFAPPSLNFRRSAGALVDCSSRRSFGCCRLLLHRSSPPPTPHAFPSSSSPSAQSGAPSPPFSPPVAAFAAPARPVGGWRPLNVYTGQSAARDASTHPDSTQQPHRPMSVEDAFHNTDRRSERSSRPTPHVDRYVSRRWAVLFTLRSVYGPQEAEMARYLSWYGLRYGRVYLDRHEHGEALMEELHWHAARRAFASNTHAGPSPSLNSGSAEAHDTYLPLLFVNQHCVGTMPDLRRLEEAKQLKDLLQFGFQWKVNNFLAPRASAGHAATTYAPDAFGGSESMEETSSATERDCGPRRNACPTHLRRSESFFRAQHRPIPTASPIALLPQRSLLFNVDEEAE